MLENRPPVLLLLFVFSGLQIEKSFKIDPTSEEVVVALMVEVAVDGVPKPPKIELGVELAVADAKLNVETGGVAAMDGFASLASDWTETITGVVVVGATVGVPNMLLANGEVVLLAVG